MLRMIVVAYATLQGTITAMKKHIALGKTALAFAAGALCAAGIANSQCIDRGALDAPGFISSADGQATVAGWALAAKTGDPVTHVLIKGASRTYAEKPVALGRTDIATAFKECATAAPGFSFGFDLRVVESSEKSLAAFARTGSGHTFAIGKFGVDFGSVRAQFDTLETFSWNAENRVSGWALSSEAPVTIEIWAAGKRIGQSKANLPREDSGREFPQWPHARTAGIEMTVNMQLAPRGTHATQIVLTTSDKKRAPVKLDGPKLVNEGVRGIVGARNAKGQAIDYVTEDAGGVTFFAWLRNDDLPQSASLITANGAAIATFKKTQETAPLTAMPDPRWKPMVSALAKNLSASLWEASVNVSALPRGEATRLRVETIATDGKKSNLPGPMVLLATRAQNQDCKGEPFTLYVPGVELNGEGGNFFNALRDSFAGCVRVGLQNRFEYMRTTKGRAKDFEFDPDFNDSVRKHYRYRLFGNGITEYLNWLQRFDSANVPLQFVLDGGVWSDARGEVAQYDATDFIERSDRAVQWNHLGKPEKDTAIKGLAASHADPELARMPALNIYNTQYRAYKKRNLQAAVHALKAQLPPAKFSQIAIALDPDNYINPWFFQTQWYDFNPDTLRQFREWLLHTGPYASGGELAGKGAARAFTLESLNAATNRQFKQIDAIDPPRKTFSYDDPLHQLFTQFKRHLVAQHYADLAQWCVEAGLTASQVFTGQTFIQTDVAPDSNSPARGWTDEAGVSIAGAKPAQGSIGAILYGPAARNEGRSRNADSLFANIAKRDAHWRAIEYHPATISQPERAVSAEHAYQSLLRMFNHGVRAITPMWGTHASDQQFFPTVFRAYDAFTQTQYEAILLWWLRERQSLPAGALLFPFGAPNVRSDDGFRVAGDAKLVKGDGGIAFEVGRTGALVSPPITPTKPLLTITLNAKIAPHVSEAIAWHDEKGETKIAKRIRSEGDLRVYQFDTPLAVGVTGWLGIGVTTMLIGSTLVIDSLRIE